MDSVSQKEVIFHFNNFTSIDDGALFLGMQYFKLKVVDNQFNIKL